MASGPPLDGGCGGDGSREKRRWTESSKVYTRKTHNKAPKTNPNQTPQPPTQTQPPSSQQTQPPSSQQTLATITDGTNSQPKRPAPPPPENLRPLATHQPSAASEDDASSLSRKPIGNHDVSNGQNRFITINLSSKAKHDLRELRRKLASELDLVRSLERKLEAKQPQLSTRDVSKSTPAPEHSVPQLSINDVGGAFPAKRVQAISETASAAAPIPVRRSLIVSVPGGVGADNGIGELTEKEKRTPKANQYYKNADFLLGTEKFPPQESNKKSKANGNKNGMHAMEIKINEQAFKKCAMLLSKLMNHNHSWVFNTPVDAEALGLPDYHRIIKHPMDLGTVKSRMSKNWYKSPREFAEDVRLTFNNAMTYNPKGQDVHIMAQQLLQMFEGRWSAIEAELAYIPSPLSLKRPPPLDMRKTLERSDSTINPSPVDLKTKSLNQITHIGRLPALKKPKAKDPNKREMSFEEKQRLSDNLQKLPSEKLDIVVQIIRKRNLSLSQHEDEIEVDIDSVDTETLWELDRFVTNYKKGLSKSKRKAELAILARAETESHAQDREQRMIPCSAPSQLLKENNSVPVGKTAASSPTQGKPRNGENGGRSSSSSSSSSDSESTTSDSDSESSSGYDSDGAQPLGA